MPRPEDAGGCFEIFALIHKCVDSLEIVAVIAREFLEDLRHDGCAYVELRTTPRALQGRTEADYVRTVCNVLSNAPGITARLLVSVDRSRGPEAAAKTLAEVAQLRRSDATVDRIVVGVDFSGNPTSKHGFDAFDTCSGRCGTSGASGARYTSARRRGATGTRPRSSPSRARSRVRVRFGHALAFSDDELRGCASLIEACPSSNAATLDLRLDSRTTRASGAVSRTGGPPLAICTDDGACSAARWPAALACDAFGPVDLVRVVDDAAAAAFDACCGEAVRGGAMYARSECP